MICSATRRILSWHFKLQERLEKEKMLTKNLGQAATKLQTVLKQTQEQLNQEREKNGDLESKLTNPDAVQKVT